MFHNEPKKKSDMKTLRIVIVCLVLMAAVGVAAAEKKQIKAGTTVALKGVDKVRNFGIVKVFYTQGSSAKVRVVEKGRAASSVSVEGDKLVINIPDHEETITNEYGTTTVYNNGSNGDVDTEIYLTLPRLSEVDNMGGVLTLKASALGAKGASLRISNSGSMDFAADAVDCGSMELLNFGSMTLAVRKMGTSGDMKLSNSGSLRFSVPDKLYGSMVRLSNSGSLSMKAPTVKADKVEFINFGAVPALDMAVECDYYKHSNSGSEKSGATIRVTAPTTQISNSGVLSDNFDVTARRGDKVSVVNFGVMNSRVKCNSEYVKVSSNGSGTINASVKCSDLTLSNTGSGMIKADGSTGNLWMSGNNGDGFDVRQLTTNGKAKASFFDNAWGNKYNNGNLKGLEKRTNGGNVDQYNP